MSSSNMRLATRVALRIALRQHGLGFYEISQVVAGMDEEDIELAATLSGTSEKVQQLRSLQSGIGDGSIIRAIWEWLKSEEGKAFLEWLIKILLGLL